MPFDIVRNDILNMQVDAIVNIANPKPILGYGCDTDIHKKQAQRSSKQKGWIYRRWAGC